MTNRDSEVLEEIAEILILVDKASLSDSEGIVKIMKIVAENGNEKLKDFLYSDVNQENSVSNNHNHPTRKDSIVDGEVVDSGESAKSSHNQDANQDLNERVKNGK